MEHYSQWFFASAICWRTALMLSIAAFLSYGRADYE
jgi:hypothetical protein